jgi:hypothetical protein
MIKINEDVIELRIKRKFYELPETPENYTLTEIMYSVDEKNDVYITYVKYKRIAQL